MNDADETRAAAAALVYRLRNRGEADDEPFAQEFIAALKARGWRPVLALPPSADWRHASGGSRVPDADRPGGKDYLAAKAAITGRTGMTGGQPVLTEGDDP
jgi:hypothetical protein